MTDEIRRLDEAAMEREGQMRAIAEAAQEHIQRGRLSVQPTLIEPAAPSPCPSRTRRRTRERRRSSR